MASPSGQVVLVRGSRREEETELGLMSIHPPPPRLLCHLRWVSAMIYEELLETRSARWESEYSFPAAHVPPPVRDPETRFGVHGLPLQLSAIGYFLFDQIIMIWWWMPSWAFFTVHHVIIL